MKAKICSKNGNFGIEINGKKYPYLSENARVRLENARTIAKNTGMDERMVIHLGGQSYVLFPWLGTLSFRTLRRFLKKYASELGISDIQSEGCCYITFKGKEGAADTLLFGIRDILEREGLNPEHLVSEGECPVFDKYDDFIPAELLRIAYAKDRLRADEVSERFL